MIVLFLAIACIAPLGVAIATDRGIRTFAQSHPAAIPIFLVIDGGSIPLALERAGLLPRGAASAMALGIYFIAVIAAFVSTPRRPGTSPSKLFIFALLLIMLGTIVGWISSPTSEIASVRFLASFFAEGVCGLVVLGILRGREAPEDIIRFGTAAAFLVISTSVIYGVLPLPNAFKGDAAFGLAESAEGRLAGITTHPNSLGTLAALAFAGAWWLHTRQWRIIVIVTCVAAVALTGMRSAVLSILLCVVALMWTKAKSFLARFLLLLAALGMVVMSAQVGTVVSHLANARAESVASREFLWNFLLENKSLYLPLGRGPLGVYDISRRYGLPEAYFHAHNQFLTFVVVAGVLGLAGGLLLLVGLITSAVRKRESLPLVCALAPLLAFESPMHVGATVALQPIAIFAWLMAAVAMTGPGLRGRSRVESEQRIAQAR
jgi:O-antigen ligase